MIVGPRRKAAEQRSLDVIAVEKVDVEKVNAEKDVTLWEHGEHLFAELRVERPKQATAEAVRIGLLSRHRPAEGSTRQ